jgi:hypothetical protein
MQQCSIRGCPSQQCEKTPWWRRWGGAPSRDSEIRLCSNMVQSLRENDRCNRIPLLLCHVIQEGVGFDRLQTLFYYLKLPPDTSFLVGLTASHVVSPSGLRFVARVASVASEACVSLAKLVAMSPTVITLRCVENSWAPLVTPFLIEKILQFPQL